MLASIQSTMSGENVCIIRYYTSLANIHRYKSSVFDQYIVKVHTKVKVYFKIWFKKINNIVGRGRSKLFRSADVKKMKVKN